MLGLGTTLASIEPARIYKEADEFSNASDLDIWYDFSTLGLGYGGSASQDDEIAAYTNLGASGSTNNIDSNVDAPTFDLVNMSPRGSIKFDGSSHEALIPAAAYTTTGKAYTWFMVLYRGDDSNDAIIANAANGTEYFQLRGSGASILVSKADMSANKTITFSSTGGGSTNYTYQDASDAGSNGIQVIVYNRTSAGVVNVYNHLGQFIATSTNAVVKSGADMTFGALGGSSGSGIVDFHGNIGEFGIFDADIGLSDSQELAKNLAKKWGAATV